MCIAICYESVKPATCAALKAAGARIIPAPHAHGTDPDESMIVHRIAMGAPG